MNYSNLTTCLKFISILLFFVVLNSFTVHSQNNFNDLFNGLTEKNEFNGNVLIVKNDSILYQNSYGYGDSEKDKKLDSDYYFGIGSIQKELPGVAVMMLEERGDLNVNDKISTYLPNLPEWSSRVKIKHLLQYSSGLPRVDWNSYFSKGSLKEIDVIADISKIKELEFEPGTDYIYSNYNPIILRSIVEQISGKSFKNFVEEHIFQRYDIEGIVIQEQFPFLDKTKMAMPFNTDFEKDDLEYDLFMIMATTRGIYQWFKKLDNLEIISKESLHYLSKEAIKGDNIQALLGRGDWKDGELELHLHHGSSGNYEALVRHYNKEDLYIILLTNQKHRNLHEIADVIHNISRKVHNN